jgi:hypothetical protein
MSFPLTAEQFVFFVVPKIVKDNFEVEAISAINKVISRPVVTGYNLVFSLCRQLQNVDLTVENKEVRQMRLTCRLCAVVAYLPTYQ